MQDPPVNWNQDSSRSVNVPALRSLAPTEVLSMRSNYHHISGMELAFAGVAAVSLVMFFASVVWLLLR